MDSFYEIFYDVWSIVLADSPFIDMFTLITVFGIGYGLIYLVGNGISLFRYRKSKFWWVLFLIMFIGFAADYYDLKPVINSGTITNNYNVNQNYNGYFAVEDENYLLNYFDGYIDYGVYDEFSAYRVNVGLNGMNWYNNTAYLYWSTVIKVRGLNIMPGIINEGIGIRIGKTSSSGVVVYYLTGMAAELFTNSGLNSNDVYLYFYGVSNYV